MLCGVFLLGKLHSCSYNFQPVLAEHIVLVPAISLTKMGLQ